MEEYKPPYQITNNILNYVADIPMVMEEQPDYGKQQYYHIGKKHLHICQ